MTQGDQDVIKDFLSISKYIILGKNKKSKKVLLEIVNY